VGNYSSSQTVEDALVQQIGRFRAVGSRQIGFFADTRFYLPSTREVEVLLRDIPLQPTGFLGEVFDCDDYSFVMKAATSIYARDTLRINAGLCFGIAWGRFGWRIDPWHSCNWVLHDDMSFSWVEPQDRRPHNPSECLGSLTLILV